MKRGFLLKAEKKAGINRRNAQTLAPSPSASEPKVPQNFKGEGPNKDLQEKSYSGSLDFDVDITGMLGKPSYGNLTEEEKGQFER